MKKILALCLAVAMLLCSVSALADAEKVVINYDDGMDITQVLPEGYTADYAVTDEGILWMSLIKDNDSLGILLVVAADPDHDDKVRLNDLTEEEKEAFALTLFEDMDQEEWSIMVTGQGTEAVVVKTTEDAYAAALISTLYYGYSVVLYVGYPDGRELSDADIETAMQVLTDLTFEVKSAD